MRELSHGWRAEGPGLDTVLPPAGQVDRARLSEDCEHSDQISVIVATGKILDGGSSCLNQNGLKS
jgi:hypothetical protein